MQFLQTVRKQLVSAYRYAHFSKINHSLIDAVTLCITQPNIQAYANHREGGPMHITLHFDQYSRQFSVACQYIIWPLQLRRVATMPIDCTCYRKADHQAQARHRLQTTIKSPQDRKRQTSAQRRMPLATSPPFARILMFGTKHTAIWCTVQSSPPSIQNWSTQRCLRCVRRKHGQPRLNTEQPPRHPSTQHHRAIYNPCRGQHG